MPGIKLEDLNHGQPPFTVPANYFEQLPMRIQARTNALQAQEERLTLSWSWRRTAIWATAVCTIGALVWVTYPEKQYALGAEPLAQVSDEAIVGYLKETNISHQELTDQVPAVQEFYTTDDVLLQQLNIDEEDLQEALQEEEIEDVI